MRSVVRVIWIMCALLFSFAMNAGVPLRSLIERSVTVSNSSGHGSGVVLSTGVVLTNYHLFHEGEQLSVDGKRASVLKKDEKNDLLLLSAPTDVLPQLPFAREVTQDDEVVVIGNPLGHIGMVTRGRIIDIVGEKLYTDAHVFFGSSGSGIFNNAGELVGVVTGIEGGTGDGFPFGIAVSAFAISEFLSK